MMQTIETATMFGVGLLDGLDAAALSEVTAAARTRLVRPGETLFEQGDDADSFFMLKAGSVKLTQLTPDGDVLTLRVLGPGDMLGGASALGAGTHQASAVAATETVTYEWPDAVMASLMERHGRLAVNALRLIATQLYDLQEQHRLLAVKKVERRIAHALVKLIRHWGTRMGEGVHIDLPTSPEDLAETARTSVPAVSCALSRWESAGIIDTGGPRLLIRTPHALISIVNDFE
jgi:CRP-like cAMP-binding protein